MAKNQETNNHEAIKLLFELFAHRVLTAAFYVVRDRDLAEDVMQETFLTAIDKLDQLIDHEKAGAWLTRIAINKGHDLLRNNNKVVPINQSTDMAIGNDADEALLLQEEKERLYRALEALTPDHQLLLYLKYNQGMSVKRISEVLEIPDGTVKSRLRRARGLINGWYSRNGGR